MLNAHHKHYTVKLVLALTYRWGYHGFMSDERVSGKPFKQLGTTLRRVRESKNQSLAEVSGAVEIEPDSLEQFEAGISRPSEDILLLMISHFNLQDEEATKLWELAGYSDQKGEASSTTQETAQQIALAPPADMRVIYTDLVHVLVNDYGVIINFLQGAGPNNQPLAVSRVGMSREHAESLLDVLQKTLQQHVTKRPKSLPPNQQSNQDKTQAQ